MRTTKKLPAPSSADDSDGAGVDREIVPQDAARLPRMGVIGRLRRRHAVGSVRRTMKRLEGRRRWAARQHTIAAALTACSDPGLSLVRRMLRSAEEGWQETARAALLLGLPEGYLWAIDALDPESGNWQGQAPRAPLHSGTLPALLMGALMDPVTGAALRRHSGPNADELTRVAAACAVVAHAQWGHFGTPRISASDSPFVTAIDFIDEWIAMDDVRAFVHMPQRERPLHLRNPELTQLIWDRPEDAPRIAQTMADRGTDDVGLILAVLDAPASALAEGAL